MTSDRRAKIALSVVLLVALAITAFALAPAQPPCGDIFSGEIEWNKTCDPRK